ncbi:MAG: 30S ribosomal protein S17 [Dehalococcoidia bacterium]|nr:30S ribosomal protein S17 [Dehalococcoidia bacterium]
MDKEKAIIRKKRTGTVTSAKMEKTVVVAVESLRRHHRYQRVVRSQRTFHVHDPERICSLGDVVQIIETRPLSKTKRWRVLEVLRKAQLAEIQPAEVPVPPEAKAGGAAQQEVPA